MWTVARNKKNHIKGDKSRGKRRGVMQLMTRYVEIVNEIDELQEHVFQLKEQIRECKGQMRSIQSHLSELQGIRFQKCQEAIKENYAEYRSRLERHGEVILEIDDGGMLGLKLEGQNVIIRVDKEKGWLVESSLSFRAKDSLHEVVITLTDFFREFVK